MCYKNEYQKRAHGEVERIFRELLPEAGLHVREEQIRLCHEMLDALMKNEITLCDAGVGIGKTYAYLTACILMRKYSVLHSGYSGCDRRPVVVSTSSIALQKAIIEEYVPFLSDVLLKADLLQGELKAVVRKGKEHFVCDYRLAQRLEAVRDKNKNQAQMEVWGDRIFEKCGIRRDEGGDGGKTLEIRGKRRLSARDGGANYQQS